MLDRGRSMVNVVNTGLTVLNDDELENVSGGLLQFMVPFLVSQGVRRAGIEIAKYYATYEIADYFGVYEAVQDTLYDMTDAINESTEEMRKQREGSSGGGGASGESSGGRGGGANTRGNGGQSGGSGGGSSRYRICAAGDFCWTGVVRW